MQGEPSQMPTATTTTGRRPKAKGRAKAARRGAASRAGSAGRARKTTKARTVKARSTRATRAIVANGERHTRPRGAQKVTREAVGPPRGSREERVLLLPAGYEADRLSRAPASPVRAG